jgi:lipopolysaccharide export system protein LptC
MIAMARGLDPRVRVAAPPRAGYVRAVRVLRYALPALALSMIGLVMAWPQLVGNGGRLIAPMLMHGADNGADVTRMHHPRYVGQTSDDKPFEVTAESAYVEPAQPNRIHLAQLAADLAAAGKRQMRLLADTAVYDRDSEDVNLGGGIEVTTDDGYHFETPSALVNLDQGWAVGQEPIAGSGPGGSIAAERFEFRNGGDLLRFNGRVRVILNPRPDVRS